MSDATPYEGWTADDLREELRDRKLAVSGSKAELLDRLTDDDRKSSGDEEDETAVANPLDTDEVADVTGDGVPDTVADDSGPTAGEIEAGLVPRDAAGVEKETVQVGLNQTATITTGVRRGPCVVDDDRPHVGLAVNGVVCSAHAAWYRPDGTPRAEYVKAKADDVKEVENAS